MSKYPCVLFFRYDKYNKIDTYLYENRAKIDCEIKIINSADGLINMFDPNYNIIVTFGETESEYHVAVNSVIADRMRRQWLHFKEITNPEEFSRGLNYCYLEMVTGSRVESRPVFSAFTTCYNSYEKIKRPLNSLMAQTMRDWEWVVLDDSPDDKHFAYLKQLFNGNSRIRLYKRSQNSGNIGNVKNESIGLCRGKYVLELDHDDDIVPSLFQITKDAFEKYPDAGFAYTDFINIYENTGNNYWYGDFIALGYGGYYCQKYNDRWAYVYVSPQINNITLSHLVSLPNHARMWRRDTLFNLGSYSEYLPINDDQEILMRTCMGTKMIKIPIMGYVQYMNAGNNNFSLIRNSEINRIGPRFLVPQFYAKHGVHARMKGMGGYDDEKYMYHRERIWLRDSYEPNYCNEVYQPHYDKQVCVVGFKAFQANLEKLKTMYQNQRIGIFLMDNSGDKEMLCAFLDANGFPKAMGYTIKDLTQQQMINYYNYIYRSCKESEVIVE